MNSINVLLCKQEKNSLRLLSVDVTISEVKISLSFGAINVNFLTMGENIA